MSSTFQTNHYCGVDVARGLVLLFGIGSERNPMASSQPCLFVDYNVWWAWRLGKHQGLRHDNRELCLTAAAGPPKDPFLQASSGASAVE